MSVLIRNIVIEDTYIPRMDRLIKRLVIYKENNSAIYIRVDEKMTTEVLANKLRELAKALEE